MSANQQVVLVTGTSTGFGRLIALTLARKQFTVFATMRDVQGRNAPPARELQDLARRESLSLHVVDLDVTDDASVNRCVAEAIAKAGRIDVLVNNAGVAFKIGRASCRERVENPAGVRSLEKQH